MGSVNSVQPSQSIHDFNVEHIDKGHDSLIEQAMKPVIYLWKKTDGYHEAIGIAALIALIPLVIYIVEKVQPLVKMLEERMIPDYSMAWMGGFRVIINAYELIGYITGVEG